MLQRQCGNQLRAERARETTRLIAIIDDDDAVRDSLHDLMEAAGLVARCSDFLRKNSSIRFAPSSRVPDH